MTLATVNISAVLCYVSGPWAYFTTQELKHQWGDDWNDAPYEHNAGTPYEYSEHDRKSGISPWEIVRVAWSGDFDAPCDLHINSPWSVERINAGAVPWLITSQWSGRETVIIAAGTTLKEFCRLIHKGGGDVFFPIGKEKT